MHLIGAKYSPYILLLLKHENFKLAWRLSNREKKVLCTIWKVSTFDLLFHYMLNPTRTCIIPIKMTPIYNFKTALCEQLVDVHLSLREWAIET